MNRLLNWLKWLYPGMRIKRWLLAILIGIAFVFAGLLLLTNLSAYNLIDNLNDLAEWALARFNVQINQPSFFVPVGSGIAIVGFILILVSLWMLNRSIVASLLPDGGLKAQNIVDRIFIRRFLAQGQSIVVVGGGTGLSTMLRGLKQYTSNIAAIVTVTDNGGSSGQLTESTGILPPGDLRNCMVALADDEQNLARAFGYRFNGQHPEGLRGHSLGNLFIAAMTELNHGDYEKAIADAGKILAIRGKVYPSTVAKVTLIGEMDDGQCIEGETQIAATKKKIARVWLRPENAQPLHEALEAIRNADAIILGPGSIYTSIVPNLLVDGVIDALDTSRAVKMYVCNVMTQPGESDGFTASDHVAAIEMHAQGRRLFDFVLVNKMRPSRELLAKYESYGQFFVEPDVEKIRAMGYTPILGDFISQSDVLRHDGANLTRAIFRNLI
jgi:uncharacterized cofD-like protein